jgi:hypothetical protein
MLVDPRAIFWVSFNLFAKVGALISINWLSIPKNAQFIERDFSPFG